jgi:tetratricopeptide (TPR) repeat protein
LVFAFVCLGLAIACSPWFCATSVWAQTNANDSAQVTSPPPEDIAGEESEAETPDAKGKLPFTLKVPTAKEALQGRRLVVKALASLSEKQPQAAVKALTAFAPTERLAQVYRTVLLAKTLKQMGRMAEADSVLSAALQWVGSQTWRNHLIRMRLNGFDALSTTPAVKREFYEQVAGSDATREIKADVMHRWLKLDGYRGDVANHLDRLRSLMLYARGDRRLDSVYRAAADSLPPGRRSWDEEWMLLQMEARLGIFDRALARCETMLNLVPGKPEKQKLHWQYASLYYARRDWKKALDMFQRYLERYGDSPDAYLQIARSHDKLEQTQRAQIAYDRFLELYPRHAKTSEIHWLRAWEREADGRYAEAIELYYLQLARFPSTRRAEWAHFRIGLCHYKDSNFAAAADAFSAYRKTKSGPAAPAGNMWEAKSWAALQRDSLSDSLRLAVSLTYPFSFYGHASREYLQERHKMPDSLLPWRRFAPSRPERIKAWMQDHIPGFRENLDKSYESAYLDLGQLLDLHLDTLAMLTMRSTPAKPKLNPWYLFVHARRFQRYDMHPEAYKLGRSLAQIIPNEELGTAPREVLRLIWPRPYETEVLRYALRRQIDPALIYALMRQESGFEREIRSSAGAVGLMQLMPATAKAQAIADSLHDFHPQDLVHPETNVRLGTYYMKTLLDDYRGNPYYVLANYNAGPEPTRRWFRTLGHKPLDEMVEDISYWETRDYVKKVMGNYWTYKMLYNNRIHPASSKSPKP